MVHGDHLLTGFVLWRGGTNEDSLEVSRDVRRGGRAPELGHDKPWDALAGGDRVVAEGTIEVS